MSEQKEKQMKRHYRDPGETFADLDDDALFEHYTLTASPRQKPLRVDKFLANLLPFTSRSKMTPCSSSTKNRVWFVIPAWGTAVAP